VSTSISGDNEFGIMDQIWGKSGISHSISESYQPVLQSSVFLSGLRTGGPACGYKVDGILIKTGEAFRTGENFQFVTFDQK
jgi:hypothetical protein